MTIFDENHFLPLPNVSDRKLAADIANSYLKKYSFVVTGRQLKDNSLHDFSTKQREEDTHKALMLHIKPIPIMPHDNDSYNIPIQTGDSDAEVEKKALLTQLATQELEIRRLREAVKNEQ